jgi:hypothetical protein
MSYKQLIIWWTDEEEIIARYRILKDVVIHWYLRVAVAKAYSMHRNSVSNIIHLYELLENREEIYWKLSLTTLNKQDIIEAFGFLISKSRRPKLLRWTANESIKKIVLNEFKALWYWYRRMRNHLIQKWTLKNEVKEWIIKWIYKRNNLKVRKVRAKNWEVKHLYNYDEISSFEYLHYDVKHILDHWALPDEIYNKFEKNDEIPKYQWTIIDAKSRFRFLAYSHHINSTMWLELLKFVLMFIRNQHISCKIHVWFDWWSEFCRASPEKLAQRQEILDPLNCKVYQYDWPKDARKNLVERSHKTDDEEFYIPRWYHINNRASFLKEAYHRFMHYNYTRIHTGICMNNHTPFGKLCSTWHRRTDWFKRFPVMILEEVLLDLQYYTKTISLRRLLLRKPVFADKKQYIDFQVNLNILNNNYAQNVLTQYDKAIP